MGAGSFYLSRRAGEDDVDFVWFLVFVAGGEGGCCGDQAEQWRLLFLSQAGRQAVASTTFLFIWHVDDAAPPGGETLAGVVLWFITKWPYW